MRKGRWNTKELLAPSWDRDAVKREVIQRKYYILVLRNLGLVDRVFLGQSFSPTLWLWRDGYLHRSGYSVMNTRDLYLLLNKRSNRLSKIDKMIGNFDVREGTLSGITIFQSFF